MKRTIGNAATLIFLVVLIGGWVFCAFLTGNLQTPIQRIQSAQSAETLYAQVTAEIEAVNDEVTKMALEPVSTIIPSPSIDSQNWLDHFLHNPTCQIPCWENITPNITEIHTAQKIVAEIPGVQIIYLEPEQVTWYFDDNSSKSGYIVADKDGIILQIDLKLGNDQTLFLSDVIKSFGHPDAIVEGMDCNHILSYRYQGMLLSTVEPCSRPHRPVDIKPTTQICRIILFSPDNPEYTLHIFAFNIDEIVWDGYKTYDFTKP